MSQVLLGIAFGVLVIGGAALGIAVLWWGVK